MEEEKHIIDFLYLSEEDMILAGVKDMPRCIDVMEDTFKLLYKGDYRLGGSLNKDHGLRTRFPKESDIDDMPLDAPGRWFTAMPAYLGGRYHCFGFKTYGANQNNPEQGIPRSILMMQLLDVETGAPLAYMSANVLSAMRTGGVSGLFARKFANPHAEKVAVIGPGVIGRYSLDAVMCECKEIRRISFLGRGTKNREAFKKHCQDKCYPEARDCSTIEEACEKADVIVTANTQSSKFHDYPLIPVDVIKEGACLIVTSAARINRLYSQNINCVFVSDDKRMYMENRGIDAVPETEEEMKTVTVKGALGECLSTGKNTLDLPAVVATSSFVRDKNKTYICSSGGIPIEDVSWAWECYRNAMDRKIGVRLPMWEESKL